MRDMDFFFYIQKLDFHLTNENWIFLFVVTLRGTCSRALTFENVLRESDRQEYARYRNMEFFIVTLRITCAKFRALNFFTFFFRNMEFFTVTLSSRSLKRRFLAVTDFWK